VSLLLVDVALVGGGILLGRWLVRSMRARSAAATPANADAKDAAGPPVDPLAGFPCKLGDVLTRTAEGDEAWLAGALVFEEERPVAALFIAPEAGGDRAILVRPAPGGGASGADFTWLAPLRVRDLPGVVESHEPPHSLEHGGVRYERTRRLPVKVTRIGTGAPSLGPQGIVAEYSGAGSERLLVVACGAQTLAWTGVALGERDYEVLPGDGSTLEPR
jgi:hypothetical protein